MTENFLDAIRAIPSLERAIVSSVTLVKAEKRVEINIITDKVIAEADRATAEKTARAYVPDFFDCKVFISKLTPDEDMVAKKIYSLIAGLNKSVSAFITPDDICVERTDEGFSFTLRLVSSVFCPDDFLPRLIQLLESSFCGTFTGKCVYGGEGEDDDKIEVSPENIEFELPIRRFEIIDFKFIEGTQAHNTAVYLSDLNFESEQVAVCGRIEDIRERTYTNSKGIEKLMYNFTINDGTASMRIGYFTRKRSIEKIKKLQAGDYIVCTCKTEFYNGFLRATAIDIDYGRPPENFVPEKRPSKPVPKYYENVFPQPFEDFTQRDFFSDESIPQCLKDNVFVVFDLETTGLNSSPASGNMDRIIEIGAYKITGGEIKESFSTFVNPGRRISAEITALTGIDQSMVESAPSYERVMPDFFKFCDGAYLVGHNAANFDFKFIEYYCAQCGYIPERKLFDTFPLAQQLLPGLSNYKLNTVADRFGVTFNHHRAVDDALATAKIFIELIKIKKVLPNPC